MGNFDGGRGRSQLQRGAATRGRLRRCVLAAVIAIPACGGSGEVASGSGAAGRGGGAGMGGRSGGAGMGGRGGGSGGQCDLIPPSVDASGIVACAKRCVEDPTCVGPSFLIVSCDPDHCIGGQHCVYGNDEGIPSAPVAICSAKLGVVEGPCSVGGCLWTSPPLPGGRGGFSNVVMVPGAALVARNGPISRIDLQTGEVTPFDDGVAVAALAGDEDWLVRATLPDLGQGCASRIQRRAVSGTTWETLATDVGVQKVAVSAALVAWTSGPGLDGCPAPPELRVRLLPTGASAPIEAGWKPSAPNESNPAKLGGFGVFGVFGDHVFTCSADVVDIDATGKATTLSPPSGTYATCDARGEWTASVTNGALRLAKGGASAVFANGAITSVRLSSGPSTGLIVSAPLVLQPYAHDFTTVLLAAPSITSLSGGGSLTDLGPGPATSRDDSMMAGDDAFVAAAPSGADFPTFFPTSANAALVVDLHALPGSTPPPSAAAGPPCATAAATALARRIDAAPCAWLADGGLHCVGTPATSWWFPASAVVDEAFALLADGSAWTNDTLPKRVPAFEGATDLSAPSNGYQCVLVGAGVHCGLGGPAQIVATAALAMPPVMRMATSAPSFGWALDGSGALWQWDMQQAPVPLATAAPVVAFDVLRTTDAVSSGCALHGDGSVSCWHDAQSPALVVDGLGEVAQIEAGVGYAAALRTDGSVVSWHVDAGGSSPIAVVASLGTASEIGIYAGNLLCARDAQGAIRCIDEAGKNPSAAPACLYP